ncbi:hypothetical protein, partial [Paracoccus luteus]|uniref:hypothetical protein n=1 Tax=Paracoccus luteus TaxID=2508543 RepID=UPI001C7070DB
CAGGSAQTKRAGGRRMRMQQRSCDSRLKQSFDHRTANANCPVAAWLEQPISDIHAHHSMEAPSQVRHLLAT